MKKQIIILIIILSFTNCDKKKSKEILINPEKYITVNYHEYEYDGEKDIAVLPSFKEDIDSIGQFIKKHPKRFSYLLSSRVDISKLVQLYPDTIKIKESLKSEVNKKQFKYIFNKLITPNHLPKQKYTKDELMLIASKFFYTTKFRDGTIGTRVCSGQNGIENLKSNKDYSTLETLVFEAIFNEITQNDNNEINFMNNLKKYVDKSKELNKELSLDSLEIKVRNSVFNSMKNDIDLKVFLSKYIEKNMSNIPFEIFDK